MKTVKVWSIKQLSENISKRQHNKFDCNIAVSGGTGSGKSTFVAKLLFRFENFIPYKHMVFNRDDVINLITSQKFGICWDDEAINSSYKRQFQNQGQQALIKTVAMYRSNFNLYIAVLPEFFSLDKDLRDYYAIHIFIIERGLAVMLRRDSRTIFTQDRWNSNYNKKLEENWEKRRSKNSKFKFPYHKLKGFVAYIKFGDITPKQRKLIDEIKEKKRADEWENQDNTKEASFIDKVYNMLIEGDLDKQKLQTLCLYEGKKYSSINITLNRMLKDKGLDKTVKNYFSMAEDKDKEEIQDEISKALPDFTSEKKI